NTSHTSGSSAKKIFPPRNRIMNEDDWAAIPRVLQMDPGNRTSMPESSDLTIEVDLPMDTLTTKNGQEKPRTTEKEEEVRGYQGDEFEGSTMVMGSGASFV
ncbi:hypothetical protein MMC31_006298, partial [Peltigera leucophlebia]|nr:hypothetical protein [Peltigera leucophlebia]